MLNRLGGEPEQFTEITTQEIEDYAWSPDSKRLLLAMQPKTEPDPEEGKPPAPPKPIVIDRYHFKQDVQGYLRNDERAAVKRRINLRLESALVEEKSYRPYR